jgi:hypothetical protein
MRIETLGSTTTSSLPALAQQLAEWRVGAVLDATMSRNASGQWMLDTGDAQLPVRLVSQDGATPTEGEQLKLRVLRNSPVIALETLESSAPPDTVATDALRKYMPRQLPPSLLMSNLSWLARDADRSRPFDSAVSSALRNLWRALPTSADLTDADKLAATIARSGTQLEANLGNGSASAPLSTRGDLKALLLNLRQVLNASVVRSASAHVTSFDAAGAPPTSEGTLKALSSAPATLSVIDAPDRQITELARQTEGALARLTSLQAQGAAGMPLIVEIPVRYEDRADFVRMKFEREQSSRTAGTEPGFSVELALDLGIAGELFARVTLAHERVSVQLRAESPALVETLQRHTPELASALNAAGIAVENIICSHGMPAARSERRSASLLDIRA